MVIAAPEVDQSSKPWVDEYWLMHCEGYAVETEDERLGYVEEVGPVGGVAPVALRVRLCLPPWRLIVVPISEIIEVDSEHERLVVRERPIAARPNEAGEARDAR